MMRNKGLLFFLLSAGGAVFALRIAAQTDGGENIILGKPTADSVLVHALADEGTTVFAEYGETAGPFSSRTGNIDASSDGTAVVAIEGLQADTRYFYRLSYRGPGESAFRQGEEHSACRAIRIRNVTRQRCKPVEARCTARTFTP